MLQLQQIGQGVVNVRRWARLQLVGLLLIGLVAGCTAAQISLGDGTSVVLQPVPTATGTASPATTWQQVAAGIEFRSVDLSIDAVTGTFSIIRLDPERYHIRVAYDRGQPGFIRDWASAVKPVALINGGYFDVDKRATALVIFDGVAQGTSYEGFGGMVVVNSAGKFELRSLRQQPYDPDEQLQQAMQSSPMLIQPGGELSQLEVDEDRSRRTVVARDRTGRILLMVSDWPTFTLNELAQVLKNSDLDLDAALNLDGGRSSGMYLNTPAKQLLVEAYEELPLVLVVDQL